MGQVDPKFSFDFDVIDKGTYRFKVKETGIDPQGEGKKSGKRYWARLVVNGGGQDGLSHMEGFFEKTKDDFSFSKMAGFLYKLGIIKSLGRIDTSMFLTPEFENKWKNGLAGREMGGKIGHRTKDKDGKEMDNPQSELKAYYSLDEVLAILNKGGKPTSVVPPEAQALPSQEAPKTPSPWD